MRRIHKLLAFGALLFGVAASVTISLNHVEAQEVSATRATTLYFAPNDTWKNGSDHFAAFFFDEGLDVVWTGMNYTDGKYQVSVPANYTNVIFCGMKSGTNDWDHVNYQTKDLLIDNAGHNLYSMYRGEGSKGNGSWSILNQGLSQDGGQGNVYSSKYATYYQLLVYSFADGDGDGIGDFKGIIDHLDYLQKLGIGGLWLSPIMEADAYHAYAVTDYYKVNPQYEVTVQGVKYDFAKLLTECHARGIKVIIDLVLNHCSYNHPWTWQHPDWFTNDPAFDGLKDFDVENPTVINELYKIGKYWLQNYPLDGYRLDAVKWFFNKNGMSYADDGRNIQLLHNFYEQCKTVNPNVYMVGENFTGDFGEIAYYHASGVDSYFHFPMKDSIPAYANECNAHGFVTQIVSYQNQVRSYNSSAIGASFLSNHDASRYGDGLTTDAYIFAGYMNIFVPGNSFVYYGDELRMYGNVQFDNSQHSSGYEDVILRTPMPFTQGETDFVTYLNGFTSPYRPVISGNSVTNSGNKADVDASTGNSIYSAYANAIRAKNSVPLLYNGRITSNNVATEDYDGSVGSYIATDGVNSVTVIFNASPMRQVLELNKSPEILANVGTNGDSAVLSGNRLNLSPYSVTILEGACQLSESSGEDPDPYVPPASQAYDDLYLRGGFTSAWQTVESYRMQPTYDGSLFAYKLENVYVPKGQEFKFGNADWSHVLGFYSRSKTANDGDFTECFEEGSENENIVAKAGYGNKYYDFYITGQNYLAAYKHETASLRVSLDSYASSAATLQTVSPWNHYRLLGVELAENEGIKVRIDEHDTGYYGYCVASDIVTENGVTVEKGQNGVAVIKIPGTYNVDIHITGYGEGVFESRYEFALVPTVNIDDAIAYAQSFNSALSAVCDIEGNSVQADVVEAWGSMATAFSALSANAKAGLRAATAENENAHLAAFAAKYDFIYAARGAQWNLDDFASRAPGPMVASFAERGIKTSDHTALIVCLVGIALAGTSVALFLLKGRKKKA